MSYKALPLPPNYHSITPYLIVNNAVKALEFYQNVFGAEVLSKVELEGKICHAELKLGNSLIMLADEVPEMGFHAPKVDNNSSFCLLFYTDYVDTVVEKAVSQGAKLIRPVENQFYGDRSGTIVDPFGLHWNVATHIEDLSDEEIKARMDKMEKMKA